MASPFFGLTGEVSTGHLPNLSLILNIYFNGLVVMIIFMTCMSMVMFQRLWVRIPSPYTGWTFFTLFVVKIVMFVDERRK